MVNTAYGQLTGTHQPSVLNKVQSTSSHNEISSISTTILKDRVSFPKLIQLINKRGPVSKVQKEARVLRKRKAVEISGEGIFVEAALPVVTEKLVKVVKKKGHSKGAKTVVAKRSKAFVARGGVLNRPRRKVLKL